MRNLLLLSALCLGFAATSHADTTFNLVNNTFMSGATATGTVNIDTTAGVFDFVNVTVVSNGTSYTFVGAPSVQGEFDGNTQYFEDSVDGPGNVLVIDVPGTSLIGYAGGDLCSINNLCGDGYAGAFAIRTGPTSADVTPLATGSLAMAATPEPSSLVLLGTGVMGVVGAARRRFSRLSADTVVSA